MMRRFFLVQGFAFFSSLVFAGDGDYAVSKISPALLKNANAVLRLEQVNFEFINIKEAVERNHYVVTILNENGDDWAEFREYYDRFRTISSAEGYLYDANGKQLKKVRIKDMQDLSGVSDMSLMEDTRIKKHNFYYRVYPYTIEYDVETRYSTTMFFPGWIPQGGEKLAVEKSEFTVVCPVDYQFRFKSFNYSGEPEITTEKNKRITRWMAKDVAAVLKEPNGPDWHELITTVITAPTNFQLGDYKGDMSSWQLFGNFLNNLNQGRDVLPDNVKADIHKLTDGISDVKEKVALLYQYMQKNTRYISIQLGVGGFQPFEAAYVAKKGYGDCKALSNYMHSILKEAGIRSDYTLIRSGRNAKYMTTDLPSSQFDHAILFVPLQTDTVWLECTSQDLPAGYLSAFTADRYALAVDENGGKLVHTPKYGLRDNIQVRKIKAKLDDEGELNVSVFTSYTGIQQDGIHMMINNLSKDKVKEELSSELDFATYDVNKFDYKEIKSASPEVDETLEIAASNYATITGKRLFIVPNIMTRSHAKWKTGEERKSDIVLDYEYTDIDTIEIEIPGGYEAESLPQPVTIDGKYGKYKNDVKLVGNKIYYYRSREQYSGTFPAKEYKDIAGYFESIYKADRNKIVLVKKE